MSVRKEKKADNYSQFLAFKNREPFAAPMTTSNIAQNSPSCDKAQEYHVTEEILVESEVHESNYFEELEPSVYEKALYRLGIDFLIIKAQNYIHVLWFLPFGYYTFGVCGYWGKSKARTVICYCLILDFLVVFFDDILGYNEMMSIHSVGS